MERNNILQRKLQTELDANMGMLKLCDRDMKIAMIIILKTQMEKVIIRSVGNFSREMRTRRKREIKFQETATVT